MQRTSPSVGRIAGVLGLVAERPGQAFTLTDLVRSLQMSQATCHALLTSLVEAGYLHRTREKAYVLGPSLVGIGRRFTASKPVGGEINSSFRSPT